jgi:hypothetical protein
VPEGTGNGKTYNMKTKIGSGGMAQVAECLPCKHEAMS